VSAAGDGGGADGGGADGGGDDGGGADAGGGLGGAAAGGAALPLPGEGEGVCASPPRSSSCFFAAALPG
jgi:hypothetical protein